jgi:hypothetical protein
MRARTHPSRHRLAHPGGALIAVAVAATVLAGCITGDRPTLVAEQRIDDPVAQTVLDRLERARTVTLTATYTITPALVGSTPVEASVIQSGSRRRITIGSVDFFVDGNNSRTCVEGSCTTGLDDARISDLAITHTFWGDSAAAKLKLDASRAIATTTGSTVTIATWPAACADIKVAAVSGAGTLSYCALDAGVLARYVGPNVTIEITSFAPSADESRLTG